MANKKIFYIEDEQFLGRIVKETLEKQGFDLLWETDGAKVLSRLNGFKPDIVILDIMLPNVDGYSLCTQIRARFPVLPIIFLTAKVETADLVRGFNSGGTDYMRKPFSLEELSVRIHNQLNLHAGPAFSYEQGTKVFQIGKYLFEPGKYELVAPSGVIKLSQRDHEILSYLVNHRNRVVERKSLLLTVWGDDSFFNSRNLDVYIRKIRGFFKEDPSIEIQTLKGKGYLFLIGEEGHLPADHR